ncbi:MAG: SagB/ThcOx family dehydrogenase [Thermodesulfobacteriota bacterium]
MKKDSEIDNSLKDRIGDLFQEITKYHRDRMTGGHLDFGFKPDIYKEYPDCLHVQLPNPETDGGKGLWEILARRRSFRDFNGTPISTSELSQLLWSAQGITADIGAYQLRSSPSAGALYPIETYPVVNYVDRIEQGIYHYNIRKHYLELLQKGNFGSQIARAGLEQNMLALASVVFIFTAVTYRCKWKYRQRAYRYIYLDAGHIGENVTLAAEGLNVGCCAVGALFDEEVNRLLMLDGKEETVIYIMAVGR